MTKPKGGRGRKTPYQCKAVWVPVDLIPSIEQEVERYRASIFGEDIAPDALDRACEKILNDESITRKGKTGGLSSVH